MIEYPLVSFCMSTYKRPEILYNQLNILLTQEYKNFEIVISDNDIDCSAKGVVEKINDSRIRYFSNSVNLGMVKSFNKSIERSKGELIVMITDDDPAYPHMLKSLINLYLDSPYYGVYAGCGDLIIENDFSSQTLSRKVGINSTLLNTMGKDEILKVESHNLPAIYLDGFFSNTYLLWSCCIVKREIILAIQGMPDYGSELLTDHAFMVAAGSKEGMVYINQSMGGQTIHGDNFGYDFSRIKEKYIATPNLFYTYLKSHLENFENWNQIEIKLWNFVGRGYVEYSLMIFKMLKTKGESKKEFFDSLNKAFANKNIQKWKYKFYVKAYSKKLFNLLLIVKNILKGD
jgi:glycosyltransferase involved in cell wall biosynthesis